ncbi:MAG TPA: peptidylprolyl isomerase [Dehalococcoidia bacterium]|nr:peptidylprolyl isomerase [Dehalococcoidia bacterium]
MIRRYGTAILLLSAVAALLTAAAACNDEEEEPPTGTARPTGTPGSAATTGPAAGQYATPPAMAIDSQKSYVAVLETDKGVIRIKLLPDIAPQTVNSFVFLAREGYFDGVTFHRVLPGFVAQGGDPAGTGRGGPGYNLPDEFSDRPIDKGIVAMANTGQPNSGGSQFFITYTRQERLDGAYTVFGEVIEGMDVAEKLTPRDPDQNPNAPPGDRMIKVTIEEQ